MESRSRPLGGLSSLTLGVVSAAGAAPTLPEGGVGVPLLEDRSTYSETTTMVGAQRSVKHTLQIFTPIDYSLPEELLEGLSRGFVAHVRLTSQREICVGCSEAAAADRALRLVSCSSESGEKAASRGYKEWTFESTDGEQKI